MTMKSNPKKSPIALAILALLIEKPMHPYKMWQLIKERAKDEVVNVRYRASLYQTIDRLLRDGLIQVKETRATEARPEQTIYEITEPGHQTAVAWLHEMLANPADEFPEFPVALAYLPMLKPEEAQKNLEIRIAKLNNEHSRICTQLERVEGQLPRLFLLESEYMKTQLEAEISWVSRLIEDLKSGKITWSEEWLRSIAEEFANKSEHKNTK